jgi:hypothetical protein
MAQNGETKIQNRALLEVGLRPDCMAIRMQSGVFRAMNDPDRIVKVGTPGVSDTMVFVSTVITPDMVGKTVAIPLAAEVKTDKGQQSQAQRDWQRSFEARGGIYRVIRKPGDMTTAVEEIKDGRAFR